MVGGEGDLEARVETTGLTPTAIGGWAIALILGLFTLVTQLRKSKVDESALILGKWQELVATHERQLTSMRVEVDDLRSRLNAAERRIIELETENAGLKRAIAQNSRSAAVFLGPAATGQGHNSLGAEDEQE